MEGAVVDGIRGERGEDGRRAINATFVLFLLCATREYDAMPCLAFEARYPVVRGNAEEKSVDHPLTSALWYV